MARDGCTPKTLEQHGKEHRAARGGQTGSATKGKDAKATPGHDGSRKAKARARILLRRKAKAKTADSAGKKDGGMKAAAKSKPKGSHVTQKEGNKPQKSIGEVLAAKGMAKPGYATEKGAAAIIKARKARLKKKVKERTHELVSKMKRTEGAAQLLFGAGVDAGAARRKAASSALLRLREFSSEVLARYGDAEWAIQAVEEVDTEAEARSILGHFRSQSGFLGGRIVPPGLKGPKWTAQAFFETNGQAPNGWLPDGMRHVLILPGQRSALGFREPGAPVRYSLPPLHEMAANWALTGMPHRPLSARDLEYLRSAGETRSDAELQAEYERLVRLGEAHLARGGVPEDLAVPGRVFRDAVRVHFPRAAAVRFASLRLGDGSEIEGPPPPWRLLGGTLFERSYRGGVAGHMRWNTAGGGWYVTLYPSRPSSQAHMVGMRNTLAEALRDADEAAEMIARDEALPRVPVFSERFAEARAVVANAQASLKQLTRRVAALAR